MGKMTSKPLREESDCNLSSPDSKSSRGLVRVGISAQRELSCGDDDKGRYVSLTDAFIGFGE
jgi:hypothetical protein